MKFFANLKRLLEPRTQAPAETTRQPTADRPPPLEMAPSPEPASVEATPAAVEVAEIRALLEAVAEPPVISAEAAVEAPPSPPELPATSPQASTGPVPDVPPNPAPDRVGDALVLTLATPPATFAVAKASATIGRGQENTIRLDDLSVSRRHARIAYRQGGYWLSDLGSMGGTWVDGTRLNAPRRIAAGEVIDIGLCRLTVSFTGASSSRADVVQARGRGGRA